MLYSTVSSLLFAAFTSAAVIKSVSESPVVKRNGYGMTPYRIVLLLYLRATQVTNM